MSGSPDRQALNEITEKVIGCAFAVSNGLGSGFLEKVYENALAHEMRKEDLMSANSTGYRSDMTASS